MRAVGIVHTGSPTLKSAFDAKVSRCLPFRNNWVVLLFIAGVTVETLCWANLVVCRDGDQVCKSVMNRTETKKKKRLRNSTSLLSEMHHERKRAPKKPVVIVHCQKVKFKAPEDRRSKAPRKHTAKDKHIVMPRSRHTPHYCYMCCLLPV